MSLISVTHFEFPPKTTISGYAARARRNWWVHQIEVVHVNAVHWERSPRDLTFSPSR